MTPSRLKLIANAGEPDDVLALRIDVVLRAVEWYEALGDFAAVDDAEIARAVRKYRRAVKRRAEL
jgi:hypothetical protein